MSLKIQSDAHSLNFIFLMTAKPKIPFFVKISRVISPAQTGLLPFPRFPSGVFLHLVPPGQFPFFRCKTAVSDNRLNHPFFLQARAALKVRDYFFFLPLIFRLFKYSLVSLSKRLLSTAFCRALLCVQGSRTGRIKYEIAVSYCFTNAILKYQTTTILI